MIKRSITIALSALLLYLSSSNCLSKSYVNEAYNNPIKTEQIKKNPKVGLVRKVSFPDIKTWSRGTLETSGLMGCFCCLGFFENFGMLSHHPQPQLNTHIKSIKRTRDFWPQMQDYDKAVVVLFRLKDEYIEKCFWKGHKKEYKDDFNNLIKIVKELFPGAKIYIHKYEFNEKIEFNIDYGFYKTGIGKDSIDLQNLLNQD